MLEVNEECFKVKAWVQWQNTNTNQRIDASVLIAVIANLLTRGSLVLKGNVQNAALF